jgi:uncharacterized membrane protein
MKREIEEPLMKQYKQFMGIAVAVGIFTAIAITGFGGWPVLVVAGLLAVALVDGACRQLDRGSAAHNRGNFELETEPQIKVLRPAVQSEQAA